MSEMKEIPNYKGYFCTPNGKIFSTHRGQFKELKQTSFRSYKQVNMLGKSKLVHRLVAITFLKNPGLLPYVCHNDGDGSNNHVENLRWDTAKGNQADRVLHKTSNHGERNGLAKLNKQKVKLFRILHKDFGYSNVKIAKLFGVNPKNMWFVINNKTWQNV